jgi:two-component system chemotaxis response regulator CheY
VRGSSADTFGSLPFGPPEDSVYACLVAVVLVVDDLDLVRSLCKNILDRAGHYVIEASDGIEAVKTYQEHRPDCVLLDLMMPGMDGLSALREIRKLDPSARVAMFTAHRERDQVLRAIELGAKDYVVKPFHADRLVQAVNKLLTS